MSSGRKGAKSPRSAMSMILSSGLLNGLSSSVSSNEKATSVGGKDKEKKSKTLHSGYLLKLGGKTLISGGNWKRRFFVLEKKRLAYYETEEVWQAGARASGFVSLEFYDVCEEKETRKATNVFFIGSSDKNLFETTRHYFSAETLPEMTAWMSHVRSALKEARKSQRSTAARSLTEAETSQKKNEEKRREIEKEGHAHKKSVEQKHQMEAIVESSLEPLTRARPRGPIGRKPPTDHRVTILRDDLRSKSNSLTTLEVNPKAESRKALYMMSRSVDLSDEENTYQSLQIPEKRLTLYDYSSDEHLVSDSSRLDSSVTSAAALTAKQEAKLLKSERQQRQSFGSTPSLILECEEALKHSPVRHYNTAPSSARKARRTKEKQIPLSDTKVTDTLNDLEKLWGDEADIYQSNQLPPGSSKLMNVLHYLHFQTLEIRKNLLALEEDSADSRRDMGGLQENLMVVRTATNTTSDKVNRLQNTLTVVEKQIGMATKEAQMLEQRAIRALESAETAEKEFSRLRNECQSLILQMRGRRNSEREKREDSPIFDTLPDTPSGSLKESFILSSSPSFLPDVKKKLTPDVLPNTSFTFDPPKAFDFGKTAFLPFNPSDLKFFPKSSSLSSAATSTPRVQSPIPGKSAFKQEKENIANKSVTFEDEGSPEIGGN